jgi:hypothetical protein
MPSVTGSERERAALQELSADLPHFSELTFGLARPWPNGHGAVIQECAEPSTNLPKVAPRDGGTIRKCVSRYLWTAVAGIPRFNIATELSLWLAEFTPGYDFACCLPGLTQIIKTNQQLIGE